MYSRISYSQPIPDRTNERVSGPKGRQEGPDAWLLRARRPHLATKQGQSQVRVISLVWEDRARWGWDRRPARPWPEERGPGDRAPAPPARVGRGGQQTTVTLLPPEGQQSGRSYLLPCTVLGQLRCSADTAWTSLGPGDGRALGLTGEQVVASVGGAEEAQARLEDRVQPRRARCARGQACRPHAARALCPHLVKVPPGPPEGQPATS